MGTIAASTSSRVPQLILGLGAKTTLETVSAASSLCEGAFYASVRANSGESHKIVKWIRETAVSRIHEIQLLFNVANALFILQSAEKFITEVQDRFQFSIVDLAAAWTYNALPLIVVIGTAFAIGKLAIILFSKPSAAAETIGDVTISKGASTQQEIAKALHVTKLVLTIGLSCLAKNRFWFVVGLLGSGYNLLKNANIEWLQFSRKFDIPDHDTISGGTVTYNMLALDPEDSGSDETCAICQDSNVDTAFCVNHLFCKQCISKTVVTNSEHFMNDSNIERWVTTEEHDPAGLITSTRYDYFAKIPEENLAPCPLCRTFPMQNDISLLISDTALKSGSKYAHVSIERTSEDDPALFEKLYSAYNIVQAGLAYLQQYPELAAPIFTLQKVMMVTDLIGLAGTVDQLQKNVQRKWGFSKKTMHIASTVAFVATAALACLAIFLLNDYLKPVFVLKELLTQFGISPEILSTIDTQWARAEPLQVLYLVRLIMSVALGFFSKQRWLTFGSIAAQIFSLNAISQLNFIRFSQTLSDYPLRQIFGEGAAHTSSLNGWSLSDLTVNGEFLVDSSCAKDADQASSTLKSTYDCMSKLLHESSWDRYLRKVHYLGLGELFSTQEIHYSVDLQPPLITAFGSYVSPTLTGISMSGNDISYGAAHFNVSPTF